VFVNSCMESKRLENKVISLSNKKVFFLCATIQGKGAHAGQCARQF
jgi:hypothetical protein